MRNASAHFGLLALGLAMSSAIGPALAQGPGALPPPTIDPKRSTREQQQREAGLRSAEVFVRGEPDTTEARSTIQQVRKDFGRLQELRNEIAKPLVARKPIDYGTVSAKTAEVVKRATRLKSLLVIMDSGDDGKPASVAEPVPEPQLSESLVVLCKTIDRFVESPVFDMSGVVDVRASAVAGVELLRIIDLGERIRLGAERARRVAH
jgi:hypothetical protein